MLNFFSISGSLILNSSVFEFFKRFELILKIRFLWMVSYHAVLKQAVALMEVALMIWQFPDNGDQITKGYQRVSHKYVKLVTNTEKCRSD